MKKHLLSIVALVLALAALALGMAAYRAQAARIGTLEAQMDDVLAELARREAASEAEAPLPEATAGETEAYCNLVVLGWNTDGDALSVDVFAQALLPQGAVPAEAALLLTHGDSMQSQRITLQPDGGESSFEAEVSGIAFTLPELAEGDALELELQVTFTGGNVISAYCASWYWQDGQLLLISG